MNKEEILARSRKENDLTDERARYLELQGANLAISVLVLLWFLITRIAPLNTAAKYSMGLLVTATCFSSNLYQLIRNRTRTTLCFTALFLAATALYLFAFLKFVMKLF